MAASNAEIKALLDQGLSHDELMARLLQIANTPGAEKGLTLKVGDKGGISVYGLQRFPVTLYPDSWVKLLDMAKDITEFIKANRDKGLKFKRGIPSLGIAADPAPEPAK